MPNELATFATIWLGLGFFTILGICIWDGRLSIGDLLLAVFVSVSGPILLILMILAFLVVGLDRLASVVLWQRKSPPTQ